ncbi:SCO1431 family membrane protein [Streptomyces sp. NPDC088116]|uniref:SCO1431 family membrane protein n=1 Tax=Streptomyces sp. NPDC088116 TaxID=3365825 RepID=UPI00380CEBA2
MTATAATTATATAGAALATAVDRVRSRAGTGGPEDNGPQLLEHVLGWTLVVLLAVLVTRAGLM